MNVFERFIQKTGQLFGGLATANAASGESPLGTALTILPLAVQILTVIEGLFPGHPGNIAAVISVVSKLSKDVAAAQAAAPALEASLNAVLAQVQAVNAPNAGAKAGSP